MKILLILAAIYLLIHLAVIAVRRGKSEKGFEISNLTLREIREKRYCFLQNIVKRCTSMMDPRPVEVIKDYEAKGWKVVVCPFAVDYKGRDISGECYSLWGICSPLK